MKRTNDICLRQDKPAKGILIEVLSTNFYKQGFNKVTWNMKISLNDGITYEACRGTLVCVISMLNDF